MAISFEELAYLDLRSLAAWFRSEASAADLDDQSGRALVSVLAGQLISESEGIGSDEWEELADVLDGAIALAGLNRVERAIRRLNLTKALVNRVGPSSEYSLRNPNVAAAIFLDAVPMDFAEASTLVVDWPHASRDVIRRLRTIKNLLAALVGIEDLISDSAAKESVREWMTLFARLP